MGGGNRTPSGSEEIVTDGFDERRRTDVDEEASLEDFETEVDEDGEKSIPAFEAFREGEASLPSENPSEEESVESPRSSGGAGGALGGGAGEGSASVVSPEEVDEQNGRQNVNSQSEADRFDVDLPDGITEVEGAQEFAETVFSDGVQEDLHEPDDGARAEFPGADGEDSFGTWWEYDEANVTQELSLDKADAEEGATADYMEVQTLKGEDCDAYRAYLTKYGHDDGSDSVAPSMWQAHAQMSASAFSNLLGIRTPGHTWNEDGEYVAVQGVETPTRGNGSEVASADEELLAKVDREEFIDVCAAQVLAGNHDQHIGNLYVTGDGHVHCIDYDRAGGTAENRKQLRRNARKPAGAADFIDRVRDESFEVSADDIADRAVEIAAAVEASGEKQRIHRALERFDEKFAERSGRRNADRIMDNVTRVAWEAEGDQ